MKKLISIFADLQKAKTTKVIDSLLTKHEIPKKFYNSGDNYQELTFNLSTKEVKLLKTRGVLNGDNLIADTSQLDTLGKLLYAMAWKNGDLKKIKHIVQGVLAKPNESPKSAIVFYEFGRFLNNKPYEAIIDQHVLRAFGIYTNRSDSKKIAYFKSLRVITKSELSLIESYKNWLSNDLTKELRKDPNYRHHVDKVLFAIGKYLKKTS